MLGTRGSGRNLHEGYGGAGIVNFYERNGSTFSSFWSGLFDAEQYCRRLGEIPDVVVWEPFLNDVFGAISDPDANRIMTERLFMLDAMIGRGEEIEIDVSWRQLQSTVRHMICLPIGPSSQDAFGLKYGTATHYARVRRNIAICAHRLILHYRDCEDEGIYLVGTNAAIDPTSFPAISLPKHLGSLLNITRLVDDVHPDLEGFHQISAPIIAALNVLVATLRV